MQLLLDGVIDYLPNPLEVPNYALDTANDEEKVRVQQVIVVANKAMAFAVHGQITPLIISAQHRTHRAASFSAPVAALVIFMSQVPVECDPDSPTLALAFKLEEGKFGQLTYMRLYQVRSAARRRW